MLTDRVGLPLSTSSVAARDAYVDATERALTFYPGALAAYDDALAADPNFALAHAGKAQVFMREGKVAGARAALLAAKELAARLTDREASHVAIFDLASTGQTEAAIAVVHNHLATWPLDALVISIAANPNGLIGDSGRLGQKQPDRRVDGQRRAALRQRLLVPVLPCDGAFGRRTARGRTAIREDGLREPAVRLDPLNEADDGSRPADEHGVQLGWDDEQVAIWLNRQIDPTSGHDAPLGVFGYRIDARHPGDLTWTSLELGSTKVKIGSVDLGTWSGEFQTEIAPHKLMRIVTETELEGSTRWGKLPA
jgi:hypothetical protein